MLRLSHIFASLYLFVVAFGLAEVQLGETTLTGLSLPSFGQEFFGGIPFAEPPVGPLRFAPPVLKLEPGVSYLNATQFGIACTQSLGFGSTPMPFDNMAMSEDCLTVNILRPSGLNESTYGLLPVMVWVYGGGFMDGSASMFNASAIVTQSTLRGTPIIYVNLNYRLGPLGYPQGIEAKKRGSANLGIKDVSTALTWVQNNIVVFGGDKDKVTVFGQSAGAINIASLLLDRNFDLAWAVILESGSVASHALLQTSEREDAWQEFVSAVPECSGAPSDNTFDCLRSASLETIFNATNLALAKIQEEFPFSPVLDGPGGIIPDLPSKLFARGEFARIPFISGTNLDEATIFIPTFNSSKQVRQWLISNSTPPAVPPTEQNFIIDAILAIYPETPALGSPFGTGNETFGLSPEFKHAAALLGDINFTSLRRLWTQAASRKGVRVFAYLFTDPQTLTFPLNLGVPHGSEVAYVYGSPQNGPGSIALSQNMINYWISFATTQDPNDGRGNASRTLWTQYTSESESVLELNSENLTMIPDTFREQQISFLNKFSDVLLH